MLVAYHNVRTLLTCEVLHAITSHVIPGITVDVRKNIILNEVFGLNLVSQTLLDLRGQV